MASMDSRLLGVVTPGVYVAISLRGRSSSAESVAGRLDGPTRHDAGHGRRDTPCPRGYRRARQAPAQISPTADAIAAASSLVPRSTYSTADHPVRRVGDPGDREADVVDLAAAVRARPAHDRRDAGDRVPGRGLLQGLVRRPVRAGRRRDPDLREELVGTERGAECTVEELADRDDPLTPGRRARDDLRACPAPAAIPGMSEAGSASAMPPPIVPRLRTCRSAIRGSASAMSSSCVTVGSAEQLRVRGQRTDCEPEAARPAERRECRAAGPAGRCRSAGPGARGAAS